MRTHQPAIIEGFIPEAKYATDFSGIMTAFADSNFSGTPLKNLKVDISPRHRLRLRRFSGHAIANSDSGADTYYFSTRYSELPANLHSIFPRPYDCDKFFWFNSRLWFSAAAARTPLHHDIPHNLILVLDGGKDVLLVSPRETRQLSPYSLFSWAPNYASVDLRAKNPETLSNQVHRVFVRAGEMLYIPPLWWHDIQNLQRTVSVNYWFAPFGPRALLAWFLSSIARIVESVGAQRS